MNIWEIIEQIFANWMPIATTVATTIMAVFTWLHYRRDREAHDPEMMVYSYPELKPESKEVKNFQGADGMAYSIVLLNSGVTPLVVTGIEEHVGFPKEDYETIIPMNYEEPPKWRPPGVYISTLPWVISREGFAICSKKLMFHELFKWLKEKEEVNLTIKITYHVGKKTKTKTYQAPVYEVLIIN